MFTGKFFKKHELEALEEEARKFQAHGQYADAAEAYARLAEAYLVENPLIYAGHACPIPRLGMRSPVPFSVMLFG